MNNFVQFRERPEVFAKYLKDEKGIDITGNSGIVKTILIFGGLMFAIFGGWWLYNHYKSEKDHSIENQYYIGKVVKNDYFFQSFLSIRGTNYQFGE